MMLAHVLRLSRLLMPCAALFAFIDLEPPEFLFHHTLKCAGVLIVRCGFGPLQEILIVAHTYFHNIFWEKLETIVDDQFVSFVALMRRTRLVCPAFLSPMWRNRLNQHKMSIATFGTFCSLATYRFAAQIVLPCHGKHVGKTCWPSNDKCCLSRAIPKFGLPAIAQSIRRIFRNVASFPEPSCCLSQSVVQTCPTDPFSLNFT
mmetsp:Transcript_126527/g.252865  ORF Transcript_126527/g.252865 Transcript_126527/m.252865 type:complete len:203 (-) Transcript_126527:421-1029(-)